MALQLNLEKAQASLKLCLDKAGINTPPAVELAFVLDVSGSFEDEHRAGITSTLLSRLIPWGLTFDPDQRLDVITFSNGETAVTHVGQVDASNYSDFLEKRVIGRVPGWGGGTDYSFALEMALQTFGWIAPPVEQPGFLARLFGAKPRRQQALAHRRSLVIFVTDGENFDEKRTQAVLRATQARQDGVYFLFLGISNQKTPFNFLKKIQTEFSNTGFLQIDKLKEFVNQSDDALNQAFLTAELSAWLKS